MSASPVPRPVTQLLGSAAAGVVVWVPFRLAGVSAPFGLLVCWLTAFVCLYGLVTWRTDGPLVAKDRLGSVFVWAGGMVAFLPVVAVIGFVAAKGWPVVSARFPHFLTADMSRAGPLDPYTEAGMRHAIVGTLEQVGLATLITTPLAIFTSVYLNESSGRLAGPLRAVVDAMTGMPPIIAGLFVYLLWVRPRHTAGYSGFAASLALGIVMIPTVTRAAEEVLRVVPGSLREAGLALGAPEWRVTTLIVLPTARAGLITTVILGVARAVGETAPALFTAHGAATTNLNPFNGPQADLPLQVYSLILSPNANQTEEAWGGALVLVALVLILFVLARFSGARRIGGLAAGRAGHPRLAWPRVLARPVGGG